MLKRDKKTRRNDCFLIFSSYICNRLDEATVFPRQSNLPGIKNPLTRSSGNKKTKAEILESRIPSQGLLKKNEAAANQLE